MFSRNDKLVPKIVATNLQAHQQGEGSGFSGFLPTFVGLLSFILDVGVKWWVTMFSRFHVPFGYLVFGYPVLWSANLNPMYVFIMDCFFFYRYINLTSLLQILFLCWLCEGQKSSPPAVYQMIKWKPACTCECHVRQYEAQSSVCVSKQVTPWSVCVSKQVSWSYSSHYP